jgi:hypothetical protein
MGETAPDSGEENGTRCETARRQPLKYIHKECYTILLSAKCDFLHMQSPRVVTPAANDHIER